MSGGGGSAVQFAVIPNFGHLSFADNMRAEETVRVVVAVRLQQRPAPTTPTSNNTNAPPPSVDPKERESMVQLMLARLITAAAGGGIPGIPATPQGQPPPTGAAITVGHLRGMTDHDWRSIDMPAMGKLYLKHLIRQSGRSVSGAGASGGKKEEPTFIERLQNDFNFGQAFDVSVYSNNLVILSAMGFKREDCLEALVMTENKSVEAAMEVLFLSDLNMRKKRRDEAMDRLGRQKSVIGGGGAAGPGDPYGLGGGVSGASNEQLNMAFQQAQAQLTNVRKLLETERTSRLKVESDMKKLQDAPPPQPNKTALYREFLRGTMVEDVTAIRSWRDQNKMTDAEQKGALKDLGVTIERVESSKRFEAKAAQDCVICLDKPKNHVMIPCMHLCLCADCVTMVNAKGNGKCPVCTKKVTSTMKVFP